MGTLRRLRLKTGWNLHRGSFTRWQESSRDYDRIVRLSSSRPVGVEHYIMFGLHPDIQISADLALCDGSTETGRVGSVLRSGGRGVFSGDQHSVFQTRRGGKALNFS